MKKRHILLIFFIITQLLVSCRDRNFSDNPSIESQPLQVAVGVSQQVKSPVIGKWLRNLSDINIILLDKGATSSYDVAMKYALERPNETDAGVWKPTEEKGLLVKDDLASVSAYYPVSDEVSLSSDKRSITPLSSDELDLGELNVSSDYEMFYIALDPSNPTLPTEIFTSRKDIDYLTGVGNDVNLTIGVNTSIIMKHSRAMIVLRLTAEDNFSGSTDLRKVTYKNTTTGTKPLKQGSFRISDNKFTASSNEATYVRTMQSFPLGVHYSTLVNPATIAQNEVEMALVVGDMRYRLNVPATTWESGKVYIYNVRLVGFEIKLLGVTVYDWPLPIDHKVDLS